MTLLRAVSLLLFIALAMSSPAGAAVLVLTGDVAEVAPPGSGVTGISVGDSLSGSVTFDENDTLCPTACVVTDISLLLPAGVSLATTDLDGIATIDTTDQSLDAVFNVPGSPYGLSDTILFSGVFSAGGAGTFEIFGGSGQTTFIASGALSVVPLPAALPLLAGALGGLVLLRRRSRA